MTVAAGMLLARLLRSHEVLVFRFLVHSAVDVLRRVENVISTENRFTLMQTQMKKNLARDLRDM